MIIITSAAADVADGFFFYTASRRNPRKDGIIGLVSHIGYGRADFVYDGKPGLKPAQHAA